MEMLAFGFQNCTSTNFKVMYAYEYSQARSNPQWVLESPMQPKKVPETSRATFLRFFLTEDERTAVDVLVNMKNMPTNSNVFAQTFYAYN